MECNVGPMDRAIRIVIGLILLLAVALTGLYTNPIGVIGILLGVILIFTGATRFCPLYRVTGMNTCKSG